MRVEAEVTVNCGGCHYGELVSIDAGVWECDECHREYHAERGGVFSTHFADGWGPNGRVTPDSLLEETS